MQRNGYKDIAVELRKRTLELIEHEDDIYEYYHPETGEHPPKAASTFGWSASVYIDLAIQTMKEENYR